jgi:hypothetical protein
VQSGSARKVELDFIIGVVDRSRAQYGSSVLVSFPEWSNSSLQVASQLENAVTSALDAGYRTGDLYSEGMKKVGCKELGEILRSFIKQPVAA